MARRPRQVPSRVNDGYQTPDRTTTRSVQQVEFSQVLFSGPLPPAEELAKYDAIVPGMAERLLVMVERQGDHRMGLEKQVIEADIQRGNRGLNAGFVFGLAVLAAAVIFVFSGYTEAGTATIIVEFLTFGGAFLYGSETRRRERNKKAGG